MQALTMFQRSVSLLMFHYQSREIEENWHSWFNTHMFEIVLGMRIQAHHYKALNAMVKSGILQRKKMYGRIHYCLTDEAINELTDILWKAHVSGMNKIYGKNEELFPDA